MIQVHSDAMTVHFKSYHSKFPHYVFPWGKQELRSKASIQLYNSTRISGFLFLFVIISCSTCIRSYCIKFWKRSDPRLSETTLRLPSEGIPFIEEQLFDPRLSKATHSCVISFCKLLKKRITLTAVRGCILEGRPLRNYQSVRNYFLISLNTFLQLFKIFLFSFSL